jgi:uncharacterized protein YndB with AHSA1/START domain
MGATYGSLHPRCEERVCAAAAGQGGRDRYTGRVTEAGMREPGGAVPRGEVRPAGSPTDETTIRWPEEHHPSRTAVHVRNELSMPAPPEAVWAWLVRAELWPRWYRKSHRVRIVSGPRPDLALGSRFHWWTFGVAIDSTVAELVPCERLAWTARGIGVRAYHAWLLRPTGQGGCHVLTEETQDGWAARLGSLLMPNRMHRGHQIWLEALAQKAATRPPQTAR